MLHGFKMALMALAASSLLTACASTPTPKTIENVTAPIVAPSVVVSACAWLRPIRPGKGYETRWTTKEMAQVLALNRNIKRSCR